MHYDTLTESEKQTLILKLNFFKKLKHPNVVRCYDCIVDSANTKLYIVMEDCTGDTLASLIASASRERWFYFLFFYLLEAWYTGRASSVNDHSE